MRVGESGERLSLTHSLSRHFQAVSEGGSWVLGVESLTVSYVSDDCAVIVSE